LSSSVEIGIGRVRELSRGGRHGEAVAAAEVLEAQEPRNRDVLYLIAANLRCLNRILEALEVSQRLEEHHPRFSLMYQERGHCYATLRDVRRAIDAFEQAVNINPALTTSWMMLERLYRMIGQSEYAAAAAAREAALRELPPEIVQARSLFADGDHAAAEDMLRTFRKNGGEHRDALRLLARILIDQQKYSRARKETDLLLRLEPGNAENLSLHAAACAGLGEHEPAISSYRQLVAASPGSAEQYVSLGHCLRTVGQREEATESYRAAAAIKPGFGDAWWSLANLKTYRFSEQEIACMRAEEARAASPVDRGHLCFALGKALEDRGEYAESWRFYERGNALRRAESRYCPEIAETNTRRLIDVFTGQFFAGRGGAGVPDCDPIFIVGLPRSGSTLVEQILASHSQVEGTHELPEIPRMVLEMRDYPGVLAEFAPADFRQLGELYLTETRAYRKAGSKPFFIDKMPNNFRHIGLIRLILPNARIIDARREPMACCFSNLKQLFAGGQEFTSGVHDIARYYRTYLDLMRHWDAVLPGRVLRVFYEDVVEDLEGSVRRILEFCGLEFEPACVEFYKAQRSVRTASSEQVRQPIFREALFQWRNYEPWLAPLREVLGDALARYRE
jgi:tetratricopeptide (TPR) repeat protein